MYGSARINSRARRAFIHVYIHFVCAWQEQRQQTHSTNNNDRHRRHKKTNSLPLPFSLSLPFYTIHHLVKHVHVFYFFHVQVVFNMIPFPFSTFICCCCCCCFVCWFDILIWFLVGCCYRVCCFFCHSHATYHWISVLLCFAIVMDECMHNSYTQTLMEKNHQQLTAMPKKRAETQRHMYMRFSVKCITKKNEMLKLIAVM